MYAHVNRSLNVLAIVSVILFAALLVPGSSFASIGSFETSGQVAKDFEAHHFNPDYHYYVLKEGGIDYAIMGLQKDYRPVDPLWTVLEPNANQLKGAIGSVKDFPRHEKSDYGAYIMDSQGNTIGTWYSSLNAGVDVDGHNVSITTSEPWLRK
jgi:hypothetical protein